MAEIINKVISLIFMTDPIADMLTRIQNALMVKKEELILPYSRIKYEIAKILEKEGFIQKAERFKEDFEVIRIELKYFPEGQPCIRNLKRISKPGRRIYAASRELPRVLSDLGIVIVSTSAGLMTNKEARKKKLGGEVICEVY